VIPLFHHRVATRYHRFTFADHCDGQPAEISAFGHIFQSHSPQRRVGGDGPSDQGEPQGLEGHVAAVIDSTDATFAQDWLGIPATGKPVRVRYMDFWRIEEDGNGNPKLAENLVLIDILGVLEQAGYDVNAVLRYVGSKPPEHFKTNAGDERLDD